MSPDFGLLLRILIYFLIYCFGLNGIGFYSVVILACVISFYYYWTKKIKSGSNNKDGPTYPDPWWRQDNNVDKVEWLNKIILNTWPHFDCFLKNFLTETCSSYGNEKIQGVP